MHKRGSKAQFRLSLVFLVVVVLFSLVAIGSVVNETIPADDCSNDYSNSDVCLNNTNNLSVEFELAVNESNVTIQNETAEEESEDIEIRIPKNKTGGKENNFSIAEYEDKYGEYVATYTIYNFTNLTTEDGFARVVNGVDITKNTDAKFYMGWWKEQFNQMRYQEVDKLKIISLKFGFRYDDKVGVTINGHQYVFDILDCDKKSNSCEFEINGVKTGKLKPREAFDLLNGHEFEIISIRFFQCDTSVCHPIFDAYTKIEVAIR